MRKALARGRLECRTPQPFTWIMWTFIVRWGINSAIKPSAIQRRWTTKWKSRPLRPTEAGKRHVTVDSVARRISKVASFRGAIYKFACLACSGTDNILHFLHASRICIPHCNLACAPSIPVIDISLGRLPSLVLSLYFLRFFLRVGSRRRLPPKSPPPSGTKSSRTCVLALARAQART